MNERGGASRHGKVVVISGPSGSGKTTVCNRLLSDPNLRLSVSATTRAPRRGEKDGVDYLFVSREEFLARAKRGEFAENAEYNGNLYGTPREPLERALAEGRTVLVEIDVQGAAQLRKTYPGGIYIFLDAPGGDVVKKRLEQRNTESADERSRRLEAAERERSTTLGLFDYKVVNDDLEEAVEKVRNIIRGGEAAGTNARNV